MKFVIMTGGLGTKLWPLSRDNFPKQFSNIIDSKSLYQINVEQLLTKYKPEDIYVSTTEKYVDYVKAQTPNIPKENYIIEPHLKKDTGPASCFSMLHLLTKYPNEVVMFYVQPVCLRTPTEKYIAMIEGIEKLVNRYGLLVTGGKYPLYPETGSDYQHLGDKVENDSDLEVYQTTQYIERPSTVEKAAELIRTTNVALHCNHLTWKPADFFEAVKLYKPDWYEICMEMRTAIENGHDRRKILESYSKFEPGKIEHLTHNLYNIGQIQTVILPFDWKHITTWNDIYEHLKTDAKNTIIGQGVFVDSDNNLIINKTNSMIAGMGLKDMVIIKTEDALLICHRNDSGKLKEILAAIEDRGLNQYL